MKLSGTVCPSSTVDQKWEFFLIYCWWRAECTQKLHLFHFIIICLMLICGPGDASQLSKISATLSHPPFEIICIFTGFSDCNLIYQLQCTELQCFLHWRNLPFSLQPYEWTPFHNHSFEPRSASFPDSTPNHISHQFEIAACPPITSLFGPKHPLTLPPLPSLLLVALNSFLSVLIALLLKKDTVCSKALFLSSSFNQTKMEGGTERHLPKTDDRCRRVPGEHRKT